MQKKPLIPGTNITKVGAVAPLCNPSIRQIGTDSWGLWASQSSLISELQIKERPCVQNKVGVGEKA